MTFTSRTIFWWFWALRQFCNGNAQLLVWFSVGSIYTVTAQEEITLWSVSSYMGSNGVDIWPDGVDSPWSLISAFLFRGYWFVCVHACTAPLTTATKTKASWAVLKHWLDPSALRNCRITKQHRVSLSVRWVVVVRGGTGATGSAWAVMMDCQS